MRIRHHFKFISLLSSVVAAVGLLTSMNVYADGLITNGTVALGVRDSGTLNVNHFGATIYGPAYDLNEPGTVNGTGVRGLFVNDGNGNGLFGGYESTFPGCTCEGWGAAIASLGISGWDGNGVSNITTLAPVFGVDGSGNGIATTTATIADPSTGSPVLQVVHDFKPSASNYLYQVDVTLTNLSGADLGSGATDLRYTRLMDFDTEPTAFSEFITLDRGGSTNLLSTSDDGFEPANPLFATSSISACAPVNSSFTDCGPADHGARFDFGFPALLGVDDPSTDEDDTMRTFTIFYGAAPSEAAADAARAAVGAGVYSYGQCNPSGSSLCGGPATGTPITYIFGFESASVGAPPPPPPPPNGTVPLPGSLFLLGLGLVTLGWSNGRRRTIVKQ